MPPLYVPQSWSVNRWAIARDQARALHAVLSRPLHISQALLWGIWKICFTAHHQHQPDRARTLLGPLVWCVRSQYYQPGYKYDNLLINFRILRYLNINIKTTGFVTDRLGPKKPVGIGTNYNEFVVETVLRG